MIVDVVVKDKVKLLNYNVMNVKWETPLKKNQLSNPIIEKHQIPLKLIDLSIFNEEDFNSVLNAKAQHQLKTWGGAENTSKPHWIGVKKSTPLHTDPRYPRYSWQLIIKVDNFVLRGHDKIETELKEGTIFLLDTHSPHQLYAKSKDAKYYLACSMDSKEKVSYAIALRELCTYAKQNLILNNVNRITK